LDERFLSSNSFYHSVSKINQSNQIFFILGDVHNEIKQKAVKLSFIFCKKSFEVIFFSSKKNYDSNGVIGFSNYAIVLLESLAISEPKSER